MATMADPPLNFIEISSDSGKKGKVSRTAKNLRNQRPNRKRVCLNGRWRSEKRVRGYSDVEIWTADEKKLHDDQCCIIQSDPAGEVALNQPISDRKHNDMSLLAGLVNPSKEAAKEKHERKKTQSVPSPINLETMCEYPEGSSGSVKTPPSSSGLPDLNASASSAQLAHQPFTDFQHVQLCAQIFVFGSLLQGVPPRGTYMVSAFGDSAGERKIWEASWHTAIEKYQNQKSPLSANTPETPGNSRSVHWSTESLQGKC